MSARWGDEQIAAASRRSLEDSLLFSIRAADLPEPEREYRAIPARRWRWDFAWPAYQLLLEVDGGTYVAGGHNRGQRIDQDAEKQSTAAAAMWRTMRLTRNLIKSGRGLELIEIAIYGARRPG